MVIDVTRVESQKVRKFPEKQKSQLLDLQIAAIVPGGPPGEC